MQPAAPRLPPSTDHRRRGRARVRLLDHVRDEPFVRLAALCIVLTGSSRLAVWLAVWLSGCLAVWRSGCLAVWLSGCLAVWLSGCLAVWLSGCATVVARLTMTAIHEREGSPCVVDHSACRVIMSGGPPRAGSTAPEICVTSHPIVMRHGASLVRGQRMAPHRALISRGRVPVTPELTLPSRAGGEGRAYRRGGTLRGCRVVSPFIICRNARSDTVDARDDMPVSSSRLWSRSGRSSAPAPTDVSSSPHR